MQATCADERMQATSAGQNMQATWRWDSMQATSAVQKKLAETKQKHESTHFATSSETRPKQDRNIARNIVATRPKALRQSFPENVPRCDNVVTKGIVVFLIWHLD